MTDANNLRGMTLMEPLISYLKPGYNVYDRVWVKHIIQCMDLICWHFYYDEFEFIL